ncbi:MAG: hypothetical protein ACI9Y1_002443 [Lentisphaeria bacterium]|jgi:hypothetical protein
MHMLRLAGQMSETLVQGLDGYHPPSALITRATDRLTLVA